jgi:hypothetical protein
MLLDFCSTQSSMWFQHPVLMYFTLSVIFNLVFRLTESLYQRFAADNWHGMASISSSCIAAALGIGSPPKPHPRADGTALDTRRRRGH